jgi:hypothetical protein
MATDIPRDASNPFVVSNESLAEFEGFAADVPTTKGIIAALNGYVDPPDAPEPINTRANLIRGQHLIDPALVLGLAADADLPTPDKETAADISFARQGLHGLTVNVPGLGAVPVWSFQDDGLVPQPDSWPAPIIRVREGQVVDSSLNNRTGPHTIHHHGIEPTPMNDGVGHLTFEVSGGNYTYHWLAGEAGTYFYHCHRNTTLHFERGMYGPLIIDPDVPGAPFTTGGPGVTRVGNGLAAYGAEALWVADDFDTRWHGVDFGNGLPLVDHVASGIQAVDDDARTGFVTIDDVDNPRLHDFNPNVFVITGVAAQHDQEGALVATAPGTVITPQVQRGQKLLVRTLNASYAHQRWRFPSAVPGQVIAADGRTFGREPFGRYSSPFTLASIGHQFQLSTARRWDVLLDTTGVAVGNYDVEVAFHHWITDALLRTVKLRFVVTE